MGGRQTEVFGRNKKPAMHGVCVCVRCMAGLFSLTK